MDTEKLVRELLAKGDHRQAVVEAINGFQSEVVRYFRATLREEADVADASSLWAVNVWRGIRSFRGESSLRTWALRLAANVGANLRNLAWRRRVRRFQTGEASAIADEVRASSLARRERRAQWLDARRRSLPPQDRVLIALRLELRLSWEQIAEVLSRTGRVVRADAVAKRFERLKARLEQMAREQGAGE